jgi:hypothetical protein
MTLEDALKNEILVLLAALEGDRSANLAFIKNSMIGMVNPIELSMRSAEYWIRFLPIARDNQVELNPWVPPLAAASGMQLLFTRLAVLWQQLPPDSNGLNPKLTDAVNMQVTAYLRLIT